MTRLPDGTRVITALTEVQGMEGDIILLQDVFKYEMDGATGRYSGQLVATGLRPKFVDKLKEHGVEIPAAAFKAPRKAPAVDRQGLDPRHPRPREIAAKEQLR